MEEMNVLDFTATVERMSAAAAALEQVVERLSAGLLDQREALAAAADESVGRIVATVESAREAELERKLEEAEQRIAELTASSAVASTPGRKTVVAGSLMAKGAVASEVAALDGALASLSVEQRIAVKAEMLRSGLLR